MIGPSVIPIENIPPQNIEAEQSVIGGMLQNKDATILVLSLLEGDEFYRDSHTYIFKAIKNLIDKNEPVDIVTVADELHNKEQLEKVGGMSYLSSLAISIPTVANIEYYTEIVKRKFERRWLISVGSEIAKLGVRDDISLDDALQEADRKLLAIMNRKVSSQEGFISIEEAVNETFEYFDKIAESKEKILGVPSGYRDIDRITAGFKEGELIVFGGRTSMGKTSLVLNMALRSSQKGFKWGFLSLETIRRQLTINMLGILSKMDIQKIALGEIDNYSKLDLSANDLHLLPIKIMDDPILTCQDIRSKVRLEKKKNGMDILVVDHIQLLESGRRRIENRNQEMTYVSRFLKNLAMEMNIPVIAVSQLSREVERRSNKKPILSDLRDSGSIEQDADIVIFIYRSAYYEKDEIVDDKERREFMRSPSKSIISIAKNRNGRTGEVSLMFNPPSVTFREIDYFHKENI